MNIDMLIDGILDSYDRYGGINRSEGENFPNRENVIKVLGELQCLIFPGFKTAEDIQPTNIRYVTGQRVNNIIALLTSEIQKALVYVVSSDANRKESIKDSLKRLILPSMEREIRSELTETAETKAIETFGVNLEQLILNVSGGTPFGIFSI